MGVRSAGEKVVNAEVVKNRSFCRATSEPSLEFIIVYFKGSRGTRYNIITTLD